MTNHQRDQLLITPPDGFDPVVGRWIWQLNDVRHQTLQKLVNLDEMLLSLRPDERANSIGTLLYHIVLIELDWLYVEILERPDYYNDPKVTTLLPYPDRDEKSRLTVIDGESLQSHIARMTAARQLFYDELRTMTASDFYRKRQLDNYDVTPEWAIYHLIQHESEHRGEIAELRRQAELQAVAEHTQ